MQQAIDGTAPLVRPHAPAWREHAIDVACALFAALPLVLTAHVPLYDLPNHIAMLHVLLDGSANPTLARIYGVHWAFVPNMGLQVFAWLFSPVLAVEASARLFCIATVLLLCAGTRALSLALNAGEPGPRLYRAAPLLVWGGPLQFGFVSYCFGIGLMLLGVALYVRLRGRAWPLLAGVFLPFSVVLLACHLIAFGLFVTALGGLEAAQALREPGTVKSRLVELVRRGLFVAGLTLPALLALVMAPPLGNNAAPAFVHIIKLSSLFLKAQCIAAITWFAMPAVEIPLLLAALACLGLGLWRHLVRLHIGAAGMVAALGTLWLILPRDLPAGDYVDYRLPWAISFVLLASLAAPERPLPGSLARLQRGLAVALAGLVALRVGSLGWRAVQAEPEIAAVDRALSILPVGSSLWVVRRITAGSIMKNPPLEHSAAFLVSRRQGFEPEVFAGTAGELVYLQPHYRAMYRLLAPSRLEHVPDGYDAVLVLNPALAGMKADRPLHCLAWGAHFQLLSMTGAPSACPDQGTSN